MTIKYKGYVVDNLNFLCNEIHYYIDLGHKEAVTCVTMDSTESRIITGSLDRTIRLWSAQSLECVRTLDWMSSEGKLLRTGFTESRIITGSLDLAIKL